MYNVENMRGPDDVMWLCLIYLMCGLMDVMGIVRADKITAGCTEVITFVSTLRKTFFQNLRHLNSSFPRPGFFLSFPLL